LLFLVFLLFLIFLIFLIFLLFLFFFRAQGGFCIIFGVFVRVQGGNFNGFVGAQDGLLFLSGLKVVILMVLSGLKVVFVLLLVFGSGLKVVIVMVLSGLKVVMFNGFVRAQSRICVLFGVFVRAQGGISNSFVFCLCFCLGSKTYF
jgi:hypothetical protein